MKKSSKNSNPRKNSKQYKKNSNSNFYSKKENSPKKNKFLINSSKKDDSNNLDEIGKNKNYFSSRDRNNIKTC